MAKVGQICDERRKIVINLNKCEWKKEERGNMKNKHNNNKLKTSLRLMDASELDYVFTFLVNNQQEQLIVQNIRCKHGPWLQEKQEKKRRREKRI